MTKQLLAISIAIAPLLFSCKSRPSEEQIAQRILYEYTCADRAKVTSLKIIDSKETNTPDGTTVVEFKVSGAVQWPNGCNDFGAVFPPGHTIPFENKSILFAKSEDGWQ